MPTLPTHMECIKLTCTWSGRGCLRDYYCTILLQVLMLHNYSDISLFVIKDHESAVFFISEFC